MCVDRKVDHVEALWHALDCCESFLGFHYQTSAKVLWRLAAATTSFSGPKRAALNEFLIAFCFETLAKPITSALPEFLVFRI